MTGPSVLFVGSMFGDVGGVPNPAELMAGPMRARGYDVRLTSDRKDRLRRLVDMCFTVVRHSGTTDVVVISLYSGPAFWLGALVTALAKVLPLRIVLVLRGGNLPTFERRHQRWVRRVLRWADAVVSPSGYLDRLAAPASDRHVVIPNPVFYATGPFHGREQPSPKLFWMRSFSPEYHPVMAVEVLAKLLPTHPDARLTMAGTDYGIERETRERADALGVANRVDFVGFLGPDAKSQAFERQDIYLHTNLIDNTPVSVLEALAAGLPVVATEVGGIPDLLTNGHDALLVKPRDVDAMVQAVERLISEPGLAGRLTLAGREVAERSSADNVIGAWDGLLRSVVGPEQG